MKFLIFNFIFIVASLSHLHAESLTPKKYTIFDTQKQVSPLISSDNMILSKSESNIKVDVVRTPESEDRSWLELDVKLCPYWDEYDYLEIRILSSDLALDSFVLSLSDSFSHGYFTRSIITHYKTIDEEVGKEKYTTLRFKIKAAKRQGINPIRRWLPENKLEIGDCVQLRDLQQVRLSWKGSSIEGNSLIINKIELVRSKERELEPKVQPLQTQLKMGLEDSNEMQELMSDIEYVKISQVKDKGVTQGHHAAKITIPKGVPWGSFSLGLNALDDWSEYEYIAIDIFTEEQKPFKLSFELWDQYSIDRDTRMTVAKKLHKGKQTVLFRIKDAEPNKTRGMSIEHGLPWKTQRPAKMELHNLKKAKFFVTPEIKKEITYWVDNIRLIRHTSVETLYSVDFEENNYLQGQGDYYGRWVSNQGLDKLSIESPQGAKNTSSQAMTYRVKELNKYYSIETTSLRDVYMELDGWDGGISFKVYNGGFKSFYAIYLPTVPIDTTFFRVSFDVPRGEWAEFNFPLDKFKCHGLRPRRGAEIERLVIAGVGPDNKETFFQIDDVQAYHYKNTNKKPYIRPLPPEGILYQQDFNISQDFDKHVYNTESFNGDVVWEEGGWDNKLFKETKKGGSIKSVFYKSKGSGIMTGRRFRIRDGDVIEFDLKAIGMESFVFKNRGPKGYQKIPFDLPGDSTWKHYKATVANVASGRNSFKFSGFYFTGTRKKDSQEAYFLVDNIVVHRKSNKRD